MINIMGTLSDENARRVGIYEVLGLGTLSDINAKNVGINIASLSLDTTTPGTGTLTDENTKRLGLVPQTLRASQVGVSDNFNRADGTLGANWISPVSNTNLVNGAMKLAGNQVGALPDNTHCFASYVGSFGNDQYSQVKVATIGAWVGACVRISAGFDRFYYGFVFAANDYRLFRWWDGVHQSLATGTVVTWVVGDILKITIAGSTHPFTLNMYRNGTLILSWTSASSADVKNGGSPGVGIFSPAGLNLRLDDWEGGYPELALATDNFNRANGALGSNWTPAFFSPTSFSITGNRVGVGIDTTFAMAFWSAATFKDDQYGQFKYIDATNSAGLGIILRAEASVDKYFVGITESTKNTFTIYARWLGAFTPLTTVGPFSAFVTGDIIRMQIAGTTHPFSISVFKNGVLVGNWASTDNTYAKSGGSSGMLMYQQPGNTLAIDDWEGGNL